MIWEYRVIKKTHKIQIVDDVLHKPIDGQYYIEDEYVIHEIYYDENGNIYAWTENPQYPYGESLEDLIGDLELMKKAFLLSVIDETYLKSGNKRTL